MILVWLIVGFWFGSLEAGGEQGGKQREERARKRLDLSKIGSNAGCEGGFKFKQGGKQDTDT